MDKIADMPEIHTGWGSTVLLQWEKESRGRGSARDRAQVLYWDAVPLLCQPRDPPALAAVPRLLGRLGYNTRHDRQAEKATYYLACALCALPF